MLYMAAAATASSQTQPASTAVTTPACQHTHKFSRKSKGWWVAATRRDAGPGSKGEREALGCLALTPLIVGVLRDADTRSTNSPGIYLGSLPCFKEVKIYRIFHFIQNSNQKILHQSTGRGNLPYPNLMDIQTYRNTFLFFFFSFFLK